MIKKIALTLLSLFLVTPCVANIHINPNTVVAVIKEMVPADKVNATITSYNTQLKASRVAGGGASQGISANRLWNVCVAAGWDIKNAFGKSECQKFVSAMLKNSKVVFVAACDDDKKGKGGNICVDNFFTNKVYGGTQVKMQNAIALSLEYIRVKYNDTQVQCRDKANERGLDYGVLCVSRDKNASYELIFDDVEESKDKIIQDSIQSAICRMYDAKATTAGCGGGGTNVSGTLTCWEASCAASSAKCTNINQSMAKFGYAAIYNNNKCEINFNVIRKKEDLKTAYGIDNFVFCKGIQVSNAPNVETYLKQYVSGIAKVPVNSVVCSKGFNTYMGEGCSVNGMTDFKDDIIRCSVGNNHIDFVFNDVNEAFKTTSDGGVQGMSCIVEHGTYSGERCIGLGEQQCNVLRQSNLKNCPECKAVKWDKETQSCLLPSSASAQNLEKGINIGLLVGGVVIGVVATVVTAGAAGAPVTAIVLTGLETVGAGIEISSQLKINGIADDFLVESNKCKTATCAKEMLKQNLQRMANYYNDMTTAEADAVDSEMARLADLIPDNDDMWAEILVKGTDMQSNQKGLFDIDSWESEQVWRAVGIGLQLASLITGIAKWAVTKSSRVVKSTAAIKNKLARARDTINYDKKLRAAYKQYAPKNQSFDDFKKMFANEAEFDDIVAGWETFEPGYVRMGDTEYDPVVYMSSPYSTYDPEFAKQMRAIEADYADDITDVNSQIELVKAERKKLDDARRAVYHTERDKIIEEASTKLGRRPRSKDWESPELQDLQQQMNKLQKSYSSHIPETPEEIALIEKQEGLENLLEGYIIARDYEKAKIINASIPEEIADAVVTAERQKIADIVAKDDDLFASYQRFPDMSVDEKRVFLQTVHDKLDEQTNVRGLFTNVQVYEDPDSYILASAARQYNANSAIGKPSASFTLETVAHEQSHLIDSQVPDLGMLGSQKASVKMYNYNYKPITVDHEINDVVWDWEKMQPIEKKYLSIEGYDVYKTDPSEYSAFKVGKHDGGIDKQILERRAEMQ